MDALGIRVAKLEQDCARLEKILCGNGKPGIEDKLMAHVQAVKLELVGQLASAKRHSDANMEEGDGLVLEAVKRETVDRERQHRENEKRADSIESKVSTTSKTVLRIERLGYVAFGVFLTLKVFGIDDILKALIHMGK